MQAKTIEYVFSPVPVVRNVLGRSPQKVKLPPLVGIAETPQVDSFGNVLLKPGYDEATQLYYAPAPELRDLCIPQDPTPADLDWSKGVILEELLGDFCFADEASRANAVGELLTAPVRPAFPGPVPALAIDAVTPNSGKTLLGTTFSRVAIGRIDVLTTAPHSKEAGEFRRKIVTFLLEGATMIILDNLASTLDSVDLAAVITSPDFADRILGANASMRARPTCRWILTGNQIQLSTDMRRRCYSIMLDPKRSDPQNRQFRHPDLESWITANRRDIVTALLILIRNWFSKGQPPSAEIPPMSNFTPWANLVGSILSAAGIGGFLLNAAAPYTADEEGKEWEAFLLAIHEVCYGANFTVSELNDILKGQTWNAEQLANGPSENAKKLRGAMPSSLQPALDRPNSLPHAIGNALRSKAGRYFGESGVHVIDTGGRRHHAIVWEVIIRDQAKAIQKSETPPQRDGGLTEDRDGASTRRQPLSEIFG